MLQSDEKTLFILYYIHKIVFYKFYFTHQNVTVIFATK